MSEYNNETSKKFFPQFVEKMWKKGGLMEYVWNKVLQTLERMCGEKIFNLWFSYLEPFSFGEDKCIINTPNTFFKEWICTNYKEIIKNAFKEVLGKEVEVDFVSLKKEEKRKSFFNPKYTFERFVVGANNRFAHAASLAVAERPSLSYNPLFIYGGVGLGKTHLLHAIGQFIEEKHKNLTVVYVTSEQFANEFIDSLKDEDTLNFRNKYRNTDVLLIDDIQFFAGKERTREEFFHTFNALYDARRQIVISSDRPPKELPSLEDRLRSRFECGIITDIQPPDFETRLAILKNRMEESDVKLSEDLLIFLANSITTNIRELEGALKQLIAYSTLSQEEIDVEKAKALLRTTFIKERKDITIELIQEKVAKYFKISLEDIKSKKRHSELVLPRQIAMYLAKELTMGSFPEIGEKFGKKDHTTVLHAYRKIKTQMEQNREFKSTIERIIEEIKMPF